MGLTDGEPNPIQWFANVTLVRTGLIRRRKNDTLGAGYDHLGLSDLPAIKALGLGPENGVELYYNIAVTPWFHVTADFQAVDPANCRNPADILVDLGGRISF